MDRVPQAHPHTHRDDAGAGGRGWGRRGLGDQGGTQGCTRGHVHHVHGGAVVKLGAGVGEEEGQGLTGGGE